LFALHIAAFGYIFLIFSVRYAASPTQMPTQYLYIKNLYLKIFEPIYIFYKILYFQVNNS